MRIMLRRVRESLHIALLNSAWFVAAMVTWALVWVMRRCGLLRDLTPGEARERDQKARELLAGLPKWMTTVDRVR